MSKINDDTTVTASFPWYDLSCVRWANDAIWQAMGLGGGLDRSTPTRAQWLAVDLVVSQACGLDLFLSDAPIEPVLAPTFDIDCEPGCYYSYLVGSGAGRAAVNSLSSRSGLTALLTVCEPDSLLLTGSHMASLAAIRDGVADTASIDAVTWHILERDLPSCVSGLSIVGRTCAAPAPPYVVRRNGSRDVVSALVNAMQSAETSAARNALLLEGVVPVTLADYEPIRAEYRAVEKRIPPIG